MRNSDKGSTREMHTSTGSFRLGWVGWKWDITACLQFTIIGVCGQELPSTQEPQERGGRGCSGKLVYAEWVGSANNRRIIAVAIETAWNSMNFTYTFLFIL